MFFASPPPMMPFFGGMPLHNAPDYSTILNRYPPRPDLMHPPMFAPPPYFDPGMRWQPEPSYVKPHHPPMMMSVLPDDDEPVRLHKGSSPAPPPSLERVRERRAVEDKLRKGMPDSLFTLKCRIYKDELQRLIDEQNQGFPRTYIPELRDPLPVLQLNNAEAKLFRQIMNVAGPGGDITRQLDKTIGNKHMIDLFHELLNSLTNRLLFLVLVEYRSWFPQDVARQQMAHIVLRAMWPADNDQARLLASDYVDNFVMQRTKNFRDVISRVCKREKSAEPTAAPSA